MAKAMGAKNDDAGRKTSGGAGGRWRRPLIWTAIFAGVYLLGRMEGEGRFRLLDVVTDLVDGAVDLAIAARDSASDAVNM